MSSPHGKIVGVSLKALVLALALLVSTAQGCGSKTCASNADCGGSDVCSFTTGDCSSGKGTCVSWDNQCAGATTQVCGCDGMSVDVACGYPGNPVPVRAQGACPIPTGGACVGVNDCDPRALCAFPIAGACSAQGVCVMPDVTCTQTGNPVACACDGTPVGLDCIYGPGNAPAPVVSTSPCPTGDAGGEDGDAGGDAAPADSALE